ncbi:TPR Domain containing protein [Reticulomyxa filosa]|uniref:TPR Domain containing protein n=1 Tax=Reticulomyxa filosa TaxID=46433 RepID=X6NI77_RETFI|nr:TPR Domain containing protein [Reticulomyxa filosa]|eukprot:ETO25057.1 TPR Domain containing protein [Reticulomyxa filosa]
MPKISLWNRFNPENGLHLAAREKKQKDLCEKIICSKSWLDKNLFIIVFFGKIILNFFYFKKEEVERRREISQQNQKLLKTLNNIAQRKPKRYKKRELIKSNAEYLKKQKQMQIDQENQQLVKKLLESKGHIDSNQLTYDWNLHNTILENRFKTKNFKKKFRPKKSFQAIKCCENSYSKEETPPNIDNKKKQSVKQRQRRSQFVKNDPNFNRLRTALPLSKCKKIRNNNNILNDTESDVLSDWETDELWKQKEFILHQEREKEKLFDINFTHLLPKI